MSFRVIMEIQGTRRHQSPHPVASVNQELICPVDRRPVDPPPVLELLSRDGEYP